MNDRKEEFLTIRSGLLLFVLVLVGCLYTALYDLPEVPTGQILLLLVGGILPAASLFWALGVEAEADQPAREF